MTIERTTLASQLESGKFLTIIQLHPPEEKNFKNFASTVDKLQKNGVTIFDINSVRPQSRMDSFDVAARLSNPKSGRIVMPHITARSDLSQSLEQVKKASEDFGIEQFLVMRGDPPKDGAFNTTVKDILVSLDDLRREERKQLLIGSTVNQNRENLQKEGDLLQAREQYGADFFMSQLVFDIQQTVALNKFYTNISEKPLFPGIWLDMNVKTLERIDKMQGIVVPETTKREVQKRQNNPELLNEWGISKAVELFRFIKDNQLAQGVYVAAPINEPQKALSFIQQLNHTM